MIRKFPFVKQKDSMQCGIACLAMICQHFGKKYGTNTLSKYCFATVNGVSMLGISEAAQELGFSTLAKYLTTDELPKLSTLCILHWEQNHFVVLYKIKSGKKFYIADPGKGLLSYKLNEFENHWIVSNNQSSG